jgi:hypothetical protein
MLLPCRESCPAVYLAVAIATPAGGERTEYFVMAGLAPVFAVSASGHRSPLSAVESSILSHRRRPVPIAQ